MSILKMSAKKERNKQKYNKEKAANYKLLIKKQVMEKYGGICNCCKEKELSFLTIDHVNNDGYQDRLDRGTASSYSFYLKLKRDPIRDDLQILCFNCNLGKAVNGGICPHVQNNRIFKPWIDGRRKRFNVGEVIVWDSDDNLIARCNASSVSAVAKELGVDFSTISGRLIRRGLYHLVKKHSGGVLKGSENPSAKLTENQVLDIRKAYQNGATKKSLHEKYEVSKSLIDKILTNQVWRDLKEDVE